MSDETLKCMICKYWVTGYRYDRVIKSGDGVPETVKTEDVVMGRCKVLGRDEAMSGFNWRCSAFIRATEV